MGLNTNEFKSYSGGNMTHTSKSCFVLPLFVSRKKVETDGMILRSYVPSSQLLWRMLSKASKLVALKKTLQCHCLAKLGSDFLK